MIGKGAGNIFLTTVAVGFASFITWGYLTSLDEVTRGSGRIIPIEQNRNIQHKEGGIISEILIKEGDTVRKGEVLAKIDNSFSLAEFDQTDIDISALHIRFERLSAEANGQKRYQAPDEFLTKFPDIVLAEQSIFKSRLASLEEQLLIFDDRAKQKKLELYEHKTRLSNKRQEYALTRETTESFRELVKAGAASRNELLSNESSLQRLKTQINDLEFQIPSLQSELDEARRRRHEAELIFRADAEKEAADSAVKIAKLEKSLKAMQDRNTRTKVTAPIDGRINRLFISTIGGVVQPGQILAQLVPDDIPIAVEAKLSPKDRANIWPGLKSVIRVSAYNYTVYGGIEGEVTEISPDALQDDNGSPYFRVRVDAKSSSFGPDKPIVPGMLAEINIVTGQHTVLDYLLRPVRHLKENALRQ